jgi:hypothetical protein
MNNILLLAIIGVSAVGWIVTSGLDMNTVYGATKPIPFTFDRDL